MLIYLKTQIQVERMLIMYIPKQYRMENEEAVQIMKSNPFALLITVDEHRPLAAHIPLEIREDEGKIYATGHIAYGNMQKKTLDNNSDVLLIFQGQHAYISSSWYQCEEVPTWDYLAVHAYGSARVITEDELKSSLDTMLNHYESNRENGRTWETFNPELLKSEMKGIVGFEIEITSIQAASKMSQNRNDTDYKAIITELEKSNEQGEIQVAQWMREQRKGLIK